MVSRVELSLFYSERLVLSEAEVSRTIIIHSERIVLSEAEVSRTIGVPSRKGA